MMVLAGALGRTGFFDWVAGWAVHLSRGQPFRLMVMLAIFTAVLSALLDNVTTVVLLAPVTIAITHRIRVSAVPYLIALVMASNIGGTATLIGDPPNILIGSAAGLGFAEFITNLGPVIVLIMVAFIGILWLLFGRTLEDDEDRLDVLADLDPAASITDRGLMWRTLIVLAGTIVGFLFHTALGLEAATIALLGATVLMLIGPIDPHDALADVEWPTLFFFIGLFVLVEAVVEVGIVGGIAGMVADAAGGDPAVASPVPAVVLRVRVGDRRQHPVHGDRDPAGPGAGRRRPARGTAVVVARAGRLPGRQPHRRRRLREHRDREHRGA